MTLGALFIFLDEAGQICKQQPAVMWNLEFLDSNYVSAPTCSHEVGANHLKVYVSLSLSFPTCQREIEHTLHVVLRIM